MLILHVGGRETGIYLLTFVHSARPLNCIDQLMGPLVIAPLDTVTNTN